MAITNFYKGFSTRNYEESGGSFEINNIKCIEEDLLNEIFTERGTRVFMPTYGTRIPILTFELNDAATMDVIREDIKNVIDNDPRVNLLELSVQQVQDSYAIIAVAKLSYNYFNVVSDLNITVTSR